MSQNCKHKRPWYMRSKRDVLIQFNEFRALIYYDLLEDFQNYDEGLYILNKYIVKWSHNMSVVQSICLVWNDAREFKGKNIFLNLMKLEHSLMCVWKMLNN